MEEYNPDEMEMPVPCKHCGNWFDLNDGIGSGDWYPNTVICPQCGELETQEVELNDEIEDCENSISDAEFTIKERREELVELQKKRKLLTDKKEEISTGFMPF